MLQSRAARYFDEVARRGSIRKASETLHIAASAIDRQIIALEQHLGVPLFDRLPQGLRLTSAGELLVDIVRRWRRDSDRLHAQLDDLRGLRRGQVGIAVAEGATGFLARALATFHPLYPEIRHEVHVTGSGAAVDQVLAGGCDIAIVFNPPDTHALRQERTLIYQLGVVVRPDHPVATHDEISLGDAAEYPLIVPGETISLRPLIDRLWRKAVGETLEPALSANSIAVLRMMVTGGMGLGLMTEIDVAEDLRAGTLCFVPLADRDVPLSVLSLISASGRTPSRAAALLIAHLSGAMADEGAPAI